MTESTICVLLTSDSSFRDICEVQNRIGHRKFDEGNKDEAQNIDGKEGKNVKKVLFQIKCC